jgi:hypothetical protein
MAACSTFKSSIKNVQLLLQYGANVNTKDIVSQSVIVYNIYTIAEAFWDCVKEYT